MPDIEIADSSQVYTDITAWCKSKRQLFDRLWELNDSGIGAGVADSNLHQRWVNRVFADRIQQSGKSLVNRNMSKHLHPIDFENIQRDIRQRGRDGATFQLTYRATMDGLEIDRSHSWGRFTVHYRCHQIGHELLRIGEVLEIASIDLPRELLTS